MTEILECSAADPTAAEHLSDFPQTECNIYHLSGTVPYGVSESDRQFNIRLVDGEGAPKALVETDDEVLGAWIRSIYETDRGASERFDVSSWT